jgi:WD40 repeat protein
MDKAKALQKLLDGTATQNEIELLKQWLASGEISIGGNVERSVVIIGSGNTVEVTPEAIKRLRDETARAEAAEGEPPYLGLRCFDTADAALFYGREKLTSELAARLAHEPFLAIVGASGSGKSSVVRAGLIPALKRGEPLADGIRPPESSDRWLIHILTPGAHPLKALAAKLTAGTESVTAQATFMDDLARDPRSLDLYAARLVAQSGAKHLLLIVDQLEEIFTQCGDSTERKAFIDNLLTACAPETQGSTLVAVTLRADFYDECGSYANLREALAVHQKYIGPMSPDELRRAIEEPAEHGGWEFEPGLVDLFLQDAGNEPGTLPLLSHALQATWQARRGRTLTLDAYRSVGGVRHAIARTAEAVFKDQLSQDEKDTARALFIQLTELTESAQTTRRRVALKSLLGTPEAKKIEAVLKMLTVSDVRLVVADRGPDGEEYIEVAHEALIREWPRLRDWLDEDREAIRLRRKMEEAAQEWERLHGDASALYRGKRLEAAEDWAQTNPDKVSPPIESFLQASRAQRARDQFTRRALQFALIASALTIIGVLAFAVVTFSRQARIATSRELAAAANSSLTLDPERSLLLALQAVSRTRDADQTVLPEAADALRRAVQASRVRFTLTHPDKLYSLAYSPDGTRLLTGGGDSTARIWDTATGRELLTLRGHNPPIYAVAFSPNGTLAATASGDGTAKVWEAATGKEVLTLTGHDESVLGVAFHPAGNWIATASTDGTARVWNLTDGREVMSLGQEVRAYAVAYNSDGSELAVSYWDGRVIVWDAAAGRELFTLSEGGHTDAVVSLAFSPNDRWLATASLDSTAILWDLQTRQPALAPFMLTDTAYGVAFSPDGSRLALATGERTAQVWALDSASHPTFARRLFTLSGHTGAVSAVAFSPDGQRLATASWDATARLWDATGHADQVNTVAFNSDGTRLLTASSDKTVKVWDPATGGTLFTLPHAGAVWQAVFSPDDSRIAAAVNDGTAVIWDAATGKTLLTLIGHFNLLGGVAFNPEGSRLVTGSWDHTAKVWDAANGQELLTLTGHTGEIQAVAFSPDGKRIATGGWDNTARIWDAATSAEIFALTGHAQEVEDVIFSPDGKILATASGDGTARLWNVGTGQEMLTLSGHTQPVNGVAFSRDGNRIVTASADGKAKVWATASGQELLTLDTGLELNAAAFSPDGLKIAIAATDGGLHVYPLSMESFIALAQSRLTRSFTLVECQQYLHAAQCP